VAMARSVWKARQGLLDPARLVFIDETGTSTNMARLRGRCRREGKPLTIKRTGSARRNSCAKARR
jgi:hypothetical protein